MTNEPIIGGQEHGRNELCPCGSGLKFKLCHGDDKKRQTVQRFAAAFMGQLIHDERMKCGLEPYPYTCRMCGEGFKKPNNSTVAPGMFMCPKCGSVDFVKNESPKSETEIKTVGGK